jgi:signal transduction histidine kinase
MTIARRMAIGYAWIAAACLLLVAWLGYREFVEEPAEFAAIGLPNLHKDTGAEMSTICFLGAVPLLLGFGWWWMRRVLAPLQDLTAAVEKIDSHNLRERLTRTGNGDEVDKLSAGFNTMIARLDEAFRRIHEFTLHASHELKTPLTVMRAHLETALVDNPTLPPEQTEWIHGQLDEVTRLTRIVDSLTLLTKADAGLVPLEEQPVQLAELVTEAFEDAEVLAQTNDVQTSLGECDAAVVTGDRHRLRQLLLILTDNAVKYNHPGGTISISLRKRGGMAEVRITNSGGGIAPETLGNIFDRFVRGENARGRVEGCGLGLTIAQWIAQAHGGTIQLIPESDKKITVLVKLPTSAAAVVTVPRTPAQAPVA